VSGGDEILLEAAKVRKSFRRGGGVFSRDSEGARFAAVDGVSFPCSAVKRLPS